jgi:uncharacterized protein YgiM (DUF1202 family)
MASVQVDALDVRQRPGLRAPVVGAVYSGQKLHVYGRWNGWLWVTASDGTLGWVKRSFVAGPGVAHASAPPSLDELRSEALKSAFQNQGSGNGTTHQGAAAGRVTAPVSVNVRTAPSTSGVIVDLIPPGGSYRILGRKHGWARVVLPDGTKGYASLRVLHGGGRVHLVQARHLAHPKRVQRGPVLTAAVLLHARPGVHSAVLGLVAPGTHVRVLKRSGKWLRVRLPSGRIGYVYRAYVKR